MTFAQIDVLLPIYLETPPFSDWHEEIWGHGSVVSVATGVLLIAVNNVVQCSTKTSQ